MSIHSASVRLTTGRKMTKPSQQVDFDGAFKALTGHSPLSWQRRLYRDWFAVEKFPAVCDLPTGLGKTMVMAIWLIARANNLRIPTRLIYVVDRRTVVDQATDLAEMLVKNWKTTNFGGEPPAISTLRGQLADNREWSRDPSRPAIIIGTVDLIGSALLFSGYRSSYKRRPLEAGLLGQDSLLVLDEAHLSKPFEKLACAIGDDGPFQKSRDKRLQGSPMRVIRMSATGGKSDGDKPPFTLEFDADGNLAGEDANDKILRDRFSAKKRLTITTLGTKDDLKAKLAEAAIELANSPELIGKRIVVFVRSPDDARSIAEKIQSHAKPSKSKSNPDPKGPYDASVEVLTGTMRGLERDQLVEKAVFEQRWLNGKLTPDDPVNQTPVFLISTSAGEVGFDLNADHLVGNAAPLDSWIQRLGRVNRRGVGDATVVLIKEEEPANKTEFEKACIATSVLLTDGMDVSPRELAAFKKSLTPEQIDKASSPKPTMIELTDILLDAWSMTSIAERMPGRPEVAPWIRGIDNEQAQTTIVWRAELELFPRDSSPEKALRTIFARHPIRPHESLTVNTGYLLDFLKRIPKLKDRPSHLMATRVTVRMPRGQVVCRTLQQLTDEPGILYADSTLIFPATFGGLNAAGMLDADSIPKSSSDEDTKSPSFDVADYPKYEQREDAAPRLRVLIRRADDGGWEPQSLPGGVMVSERLQLKSDYSTSTSLFTDFRKNGLRIRQVQSVTFDEEGDAVQSLVMLSPASNKGKPDDQSLDDHVGAVEAEARRIASALHFADDDPVRIALLFAARWHDEGKKADIWQRFVHGPDANGYKGKSSQSRDPKSLRGYRHEFGSLLRIEHPNRCGTAGCESPTDPDARELTLHLIATHHGMARPHFSTAVYQNFSDTERDTIHTNVIRRFGHLQRKYGWWRLAWLENLLRCADALASADQESEDDPADAEGDAI